MDSSVCREYANCVVESPDVFDVSEVNGKALVLIAEPPVQLHDAVRRAATSCPVKAITITE
ncbi:MAG: ferredoxin [Jatrophihabitantaceae bacterium]